MNIIPKIHHFLWKVLHAILPTCINFVGRFVDVDICARGRGVVESAEHALWDCIFFVREFWEQKSPVRGAASCGPLEEWVVALLSSLSEEEQCLFATML